MILRWTSELGRGIIDCAFVDGSSEIIAGDVSGGVFLIDSGGSVVNHIECGLPVWGISANSSVAVAALGMNSPRKGGLVILERASLRPIREIPFDVPVWDVALSAAGTILATTWGQGLMELVAPDAPLVRIPCENNLYGLSIHDTSALVTVAGVGLAAYKIGTGEALELVMSGASHACYKHTVSGSRVVVGSSRDEIYSFDGTNKSLMCYRVTSRNVCGIAAIGTTVVYGDLDGTLSIAHIDNLGLAFSRISVGGGVWSIRIDEACNRLLVAGGDGRLYCFEGDFRSIHEASSWSVDTEVISPVLLEGARVFICHAREDGEIAEALYHGLKAEGCRPWLDKQSLLPGEDWQQAIPKAIKTSDFVVVCMSSRSVSKRGFVQKEMSIALDVVDELPLGEIYVLPVKLDKCETPERLARFQWIGYQSSDFFRKLLLSIQKAQLRRRARHPAARVDTGKSKPGDP